METSRLYGKNKPTFLDERDMEDTRDFDEVFVAVKYKILNKIPMLTAKEELVEQMIMDAVDAFGYDFIFRVTK